MCIFIGQTGAEAEPSAVNRLRTAPTAQLGELLRDASRTVPAPQRTSEMTIRNGVCKSAGSRAVHAKDSAHISYYSKDVQLAY